MRFCCSTSCSSASLLPVFIASLFFFLFSFALFSPVCILHETLKTLKKPQRNPKETLNEALQKTLNETLNEKKKTQIKP